LTFYCLTLGECHFIAIFTNPIQEKHGLKKLSPYGWYRSLPERDPVNRPRKKPIREAKLLRTQFNKEAASPD
jgi:hypothetical protein